MPFERIPKIIYGTAWKKDRTTQLVLTAILSGFRGIDTAAQPKYYSEKSVGEALTILSEKHKISRSNIFLQTKFTPLAGQDQKNVPYDKNAELEMQVEQSFKSSLENLRTDYIDALLLNSPFPKFEDTMKVWRKFEILFEEKKVYRLGISNIYSLEQLKEISQEAKHKPTIIQNRFYPDSNYDLEIRNFCERHCMNYQSFWTLTGNPNVLSDPDFIKISDRLKLTKEQLFLKYVMQLGIIPLIGTSDMEHMKKDLELLSLKDLEKDVVKEIEDLMLIEK